MDDEGASTPGNVDISEIELILGWLHVNFSKAERKKIFSETDCTKIYLIWSSLSFGKILKREARSNRY